MKEKAFFIIFKELSVAQNCLRTESTFNSLITRSPERKCAGVQRFIF